jgi:hypothetical protein
MSVSDAWNPEDEEDVQPQEVYPPGTAVPITVEDGEITAVGGIEIKKVGAGDGE